MLRYVVNWFNKAVSVFFTMQLLYYCTIIKTCLWINMEVTDREVKNMTEWVGTIYGNNTAGPW